MNTVLFLLLLTQEARLEGLRNLGKAFYENPTTQKEAVATLKQAYDLAPNSQRERLNYGLALLRAGQNKEAIAELLAVQKAQPALPHTWFTLGIEYKKQGETQLALTQMREAARLDPKEPIIQYNLGVLMKQLGDNAGATAAFERAAQLDPNLAAARFQLFNMYRQAGKAEQARQQLEVFQSLKKLTEGAAVPEDVDWCQYSEIYDPKPAPPPPSKTAVRFQDRPLADNWTGAIAFGHRVVYWDGQGVALHRKRIAAVSGVRDVSAGDYNNDGLMDLCVAGEEMPILLEQTATGWRQLPLPARGAFARCVWLDYDHDYDLDLVLLGKEQVLLRNQGPKGFENRSEDFPFQPGEATGAVVTRVAPDTRGFDLVVAYAGGPGVLYRDLLLGKYKAEPLALLPAGATHLLAADIDQDSKLDLLYHVNGKAAWLAGHEKVMAVTNVSGRATVADLRNEGRFEVVAGHVALDLNGDGKLDVVDRGEKGWVERLNVTPLTNRVLRLTLEGVKNMKSAPAAEVEVRVGGLYQKQLYQGFGVQFGVGRATQVEVVRITWPNGLIQNEMKQAVAKPLVYKEAQRLSGSCPIVWTWNGKEFEYVTDVLGVAPLGAAAGDGTFFTPDHDEYIAIAAEQLQPNAAGRLEIRMTEELSEAAYFDQVRLLVVDHPEKTRVYSNEKWKGPPFPEFRLYGVEKPIHARRATDHKGNDVTGLLAAKDRTYPNSFQRTTAGVAEMHTLTLDFGPGAAPENDAILVLAGWVDWADGSTFLAAAQEGEGLKPPSLQVKDKNGQWVTVIEDMGMPSGKPKTITVDLTGKFLSASREVRIVTNMCVYWDEIFLSEGSKTPEHRLTALEAVEATLQFRGFSPSIIHPERLQPEEFLYPNPEPTSLWNPTPGKYTRYGDVKELLKRLDDQLMVMGSGDEVRLEFDSKGLPPLPAGWRRDYLLHVDGWAKDRDANTSNSQTVGPLPFHSMSGYPYGPAEKSPGAEAAERYNTRNALILLRPLVGK